MAHFRQIRESRNLLRNDFISLFVGGLPQKKNQYHAEHRQELYCSGGVALKQMKAITIPAVAQRTPMFDVQRLALVSH